MAAATINDFEIINNGQQLAIDVETQLGSIITSILLWDINTFKEDSLKINLSSKLEQISNREVIIVNATELGLKFFTDIYFIEIESNYVGPAGCTTCQDPALGITYDLQQYYKCMLNYLLNSEINKDPKSVNVFATNLPITVNLLIDAIEKSLDIGYYLQAIEMLNQLKKICSISKCKNCQTITCSSCSTFVAVPPAPIT